MGHNTLRRASIAKPRIQFQNAIELDPRYAEAHYQLSQCFPKMEIWSAAFTELSRTVDLNPQDSKARLDLGNLLAARLTKKAEEQSR